MLRDFIIRSTLRNRILSNFDPLATFSKLLKGITYNFAAHTSESGRTYSMVFVKGEENLGKYVGSRSSLSERAASDLKSITAENTANRSQAIQRSVWVQATNISVMVPDFKVENYDFRKVVLFTVPFDKVAEYDKLIEQTIAEDKALGISYNYIMYRAVDGYPNNTYMMILPDKSRLQYYTHQDERNAKRKGQTKLAELNKKASQLRTTIRLDHLSRVAGQ
jgi:predicted nuclease of restriction endonuclease-like RecB superfamily